MISEYGILLICSMILAGYTRYVHVQIKNFCKDCQHEFTPIKKEKEIIPSL